MPVYEYYCPANGVSLEVVHGMKEKVQSWGELCQLAGKATGDTAAETPVERLLFPPGVSTPAGDSKLKEMGFTKLVKRDDGVYENVTRGDKDNRYMLRGDSSTVPNLKGKISD